MPNLVKAHKDISDLTYTNNLLKNNLKEVGNNLLRYKTELQTIEEELLKIYEQNKQLLEKKYELEKANVLINEQLKNIISSKSFRVGRLITFPFRMIRSFIHTFKHYGFKKAITKSNEKILKTIKRINKK